MGLPPKLKNMNVFADGQIWLGEVTEITLPQIKLKTESYRGGGMLGEVDIVLGIDKLEMETKLGGLVLGAMRQFGRVGVSDSMLRFTGAYQEDVAGGVLAAELVTRGRHTEINPGNAKVGDNTEWTLKSMLTYLKWTVRGRVEIEIDLLNNVFIVDGEDRMAPIRAAIQQ